MKKVTIDLFNYEVYLIENDCDIKKAAKYLESSKIKEALYEDDYVGICLTYYNRSYIIVKDDKISTLAHEVLHSVQRICERRGVSDYETEAYLMDYILERLIDDKKNKIKGE